MHVRAVDNSSLVYSSVLITCRRQEAQSELRKKLLQHKEIDAKVRNLRDQAKELKGHYDKTEDDLKALQSVGQIIGEVLRQLGDERCECPRLPLRSLNVRQLLNARSSQSQETPRLGAVLCHTASVPCSPRCKKFQHR